MAKKKRRRLKKSVKRGCALLVAVPVALYLFIGLAVQRCSVERGAEGDATRSEVRSDDAQTDNPSDAQTNIPDDTQTDPGDDAEALRRKIGGRLEALLAIPHNLDTATIAIEVYDIATQTTLYSRHADRLATPASCLKLLTAVAAMQYLGLGHTWVTQVGLDGQQVGDAVRGNVVIQCDDDPTVETLEPLVDALRRRGISRIEGDVALSLLREDTLKAHPTAATWDIPYHKLPILLKGRPRIERDLRYLLAAKGITCRGIASGAPAPDTCEVVYRHETPLGDVLAPMLIHSSNIKADALHYHLCHALGRPPLVDLPEDWWAWATVARADGPHRDFVINDGSGLSPQNRLTAHFLVRLLRYAWDREPMRRFLLDEALATPGHPTRHGSLLTRMTAPPFRNRIFVKTGTLTTIGLSSLAGYAQTQDGRWLAFAVINTDSPVLDSRIFQDKVCRELVR